MPTTPIAPRRTIRAWKGLAIAGALGIAMLAAPAAATAVPQQAHDDVPHCAIDSAELRWGVKERFRSYISGSIANGEWTVSDDMRYETPDFIWDSAQGDLEGSLDAGSIAFTGAVHFTGHDGLLQLDLQDPVIEFVGDDEAYLALTIGSTDSGDAAAVNLESLRVAKMDLGSSLTAGGSQLVIDGALPYLTAEGAAALNGAYGSYVAGEDLDPISMVATVSGCELGTVEAQAPEAGASTGEAAEPVTEQESSVPWLPIAAGAFSLIVMIVTGIMLFKGRKKKPGAAADGSTDGASEGAATDTAPEGTASNE